MTRYYLALAIDSLRRTPWLSLLMVLSLAVGIAASMTTITLRYVLGLDPVPDRSGRLFNLGDPSSSSPLGNVFSYADATTLGRLSGDKAIPVLSGAGITDSLTAAGHEETITQGVGIRYASASFFRVFDVPLKRGRIWNPREEESAAPVVVLEEGTARELFQGDDALGKQLVIGHTQYTVIGLTGPWNPQPRYYDLHGVAGAFGGGGDAIFLPVTTMRYAPERLMVNTACPGATAAPSSPPELLSSSCRWLQLWFLAGTSADARELKWTLGHRMQTTLLAGDARNVRLMDVGEVLTHADVVPTPVRLYAMLGAGFLLLCAVNASGMQLSRVLRASSQIGVRRALGAKRADIIGQYLCDSLLVCGIGGVLGMGLTFLGLYTVRHLPDLYYGDLVHMDGRMFSLMVALVVGCGTLVGVIPAWLASRTDPALLIKAPQ